MPLPSSLRIRTLLPLLLGAGLLLGAAILISLQRYRSLEHARWDQRQGVERTLFELRNGLSDLLVSGQRELAERRFLDGLLDPRIQVLMVVDETGNVVFSSHRQWLGQRAEGVEGFDVVVAEQVAKGSQARYAFSGRSCLVGYLPIRVGFREGTLRGGRQGVVFVTFDFAESFKAIRGRLLVEAAWGAGYFVALMLLLWLVLDRWITRRMDRVVATMRRVEAGDLGARAGMTGQGELARLGRALDALLDRMVVAQGELQESREFLNQILENLPLMVFVKDALDLRYLRLNKAGEELLGYSREDLLGKNDFDLFPREQAVFFAEKDREVLAGGRLVDSPEEPIRTRLRGDRLLRTLKVPVVDAQGVPRFLLGISLDITDQRQAEDSLRKAQVALDQSPVNIMITDAVGNIDYVNPAFTLNTGFTAAEALGKNPRFLKSGEHSPEFYRELWDTLLRGGTWSGQLCNLRKDGSRIWERTTISPLRDELGRITHFVAVKENITEALRLEAENRQLEQQVANAQKMEGLGSLASGVAHDMNNVLAGILGLSSVLREQVPAASALQQAFDKIAQACDRGAGLVKELLAFARQELAEERIVDLNALVREQLPRLGLPAGPGLRVEVEADPELRPVKGDPSALAMALGHLCRNAREAMSEGGTLTIRTRNQGVQEVCLEIEDTGRGMSEQVQEHALDPFFTTKPDGHGKGLGLSATYAVVKAHRGKLELRSTPGSGTRVTLLFPVTEQPHEPAPVLGLGRSLRVLVVDDDELVQESTTALLQALGHQATVAERGEAALELLEQGDPVDLVILDLNMPGLGGAGTLPRLRALCPDLPVFLATGRADQTALDLIARTPGVTLLPKPFSLNELRARLG